MNINQAVTEYRQLSVSQAMAEAASEVALNNATRQKENFFLRINESMSELIEQNATDVFSATLLFSEMSMRKIGQFSPFLAYYYGTMSQQLTTIPLKQQSCCLASSSLCLVSAP